MKDYIVIDGKEIALSAETVAELKDKLKKPVFYHRGQLFKHRGNGDIYILAKTVRDSSMMALVSINNGNWWNNSIKVYNLFRITEEEFSKLNYDNSFTPLTGKMVYKES